MRGISICGNDRWSLNVAYRYLACRYLAVDRWNLSEGEFLRLMQIRNSARSSELKSKEKLEYRRLAFEIESENRRRELEQAKIEVEEKRARTEEERDARLQRKEERDARIEEMII
jgi:hypothetical protein